MMPAEKRCRRCGETKPLTAFYACYLTRDRRHSYCMECCRAYSRERYEPRRRRPRDVEAAQ